jgi:hypothetical protein
LITCEKGDPKDKVKRKLAIWGLGLSACVEDGIDIRDKINAAY